MKIAVGSDHAGFTYKSMLVEFLIGKGHVVKDFGTFSKDSVDYPVYIRPVALAVSKGEYERGIVLGGSGNGEAMTANRIKGIRCALCWNKESALLARKHNDANMISLGERMITKEDVIEIVQTWIETPFEGGRHINRIRQIDEEIPPFELKKTSDIKNVSYENDDFNVVISFGYILYTEGKRSTEFRVEPGLKGPTLIYIPSPENWNRIMPDWVQNRRDQIIERITLKCKHLIFEYREF